MAKAFTANVTALKGDPKNPESAQHIITFPGGSIEVSRTEDNEYWVHIAVNHGKQLLEDNFNCANGTIVDSRIDRDYPNDISELENMETIKHIAVRIKIAT